MTCGPECIPNLMNKCNKISELSEKELQDAIKSYRAYHALMIKNYTPQQIADSKRFSSLGSKPNDVRAKMYKWRDKMKPLDLSHPIAKGVANAARHIIEQDDELISAQRVTDAQYASTREIAPQHTLVNKDSSSSLSSLASDCPLTPPRYASASAESSATQEQARPWRPTHSPLDYAQSELLLGNISKRLAYADHNLIQQFGLQNNSKKVVALTALKELYYCVSTLLVYGTDNGQAAWNQTRTALQRCRGTSKVSDQTVSAALGEVKYMVECIRSKNPGIVDSAAQIYQETNAYRPVVAPAADTGVDGTKKKKKKKKL